MSDKKKWWFWYIGSVVFGWLILWAFTSLLMPQMYLSDATTIYEGKIVEVVTNGPTEVVAYTDEGVKPTSLINENGEVILTTVAGLKPGYFEGKGLVVTGRYTVTNGRLGLIFKGHEFVSYRNLGIEEVNSKMMTFVSCVYFLVMSLFHRSFYPGK